MGDARTEEEKYDEWVLAVVKLWAEGWRNHGGDWVFEAPEGTFHDLSSANLECLHTIQKEGLFLINTEE